VIRPARPEDADGIAAIWNAIIRDTALTFTTAEKDPAAIAAAMPVQPYFVAHTAGQVAGFVTYFQFRGGPGYAHTMEHSIHIAEGFRGAGLGRALMAVCEDHARGAGVHSLFAGVGGENPDGVAFHAALGYTEVARLREVGRKFGRWHDLVLMQKFL
jgi:phosphinothricin acetyltransferase